MAVKLIIKDLDDPQKCRVEGAGFDVRPVKDAKDLKPFALPGETGYHPHLWGAAAHFYGRPPNDFYCDEGTGAQLRRTFRSARILSMRADPEIISAVRLDNEDNGDDGQFDAGVSRNVANTAERTHGGHVTLGWSLTVGVEIGGEAAQAKSKVEQTWSFEAGYEYSQSKSDTKELGANIGTSVTLKPGQVKRSVLYAAFGEAEIEVEYDIELIGYGRFRYKKGLPNIGNNAGQDLYQLRKRLREQGYDSPHIVQARERVEIGVFGDSYARLEDVIG